MGKMISLYLKDEEAKELTKFCEENQCSQYSAIKIALKELLSKPFRERQKVPQQNEIVQQQGEKSKEIRESKQPSNVLVKLLKEFQKAERESQSEVGLGN